MTLSAEQLRTGVTQVPVGRVRVSTRVVTETRTLTVQVRREELVIEHLPLDSEHPPVGEPSARPLESGPALELELREETIEIVTRVVPVERVRIYLDRVADTEQVTAELAREQVEITENGLTATEESQS